MSDPNQDLPPMEEIEAAEAFRETMRSKADDPANLMWYGWVIMDAFLAGIQWERNRTK